MDNRKRTIELPDDGSETVVIRSGVKVEFNAGGVVTIYTNGDVKVQPACNDDAQLEAAVPRRPGDTMEDGTIFAGISPDTGKPLYTTPADAPQAMKWKEAIDYASGLRTHGHKDWRLPSKAELKVLFNNRAAIGGFDTSGSFPVGYHWSSSAGNGRQTVSYQRFSDGSDGNFYKCLALSVRCVR